MEVVLLLSLLMEALIMFVLIRFGDTVIELLIKICADVSFIEDLVSREKANEMVDRLIKEGYVATGKKVK